MKWLNLSQAQRDREFASLYAADASDRLELLVRYAIVSACGVALWAVSGSWLMPVWAGGYLVFAGIYVRLLKRTVTPVSRGRFAALLCGSLFVALWFSLMLLFLASLGELPSILLGVLGCCGLALHALTRNDGFNFGAYIDLFATLFSTCGVLILAAMAAPTAMGKATILVGGLSVSVYFLISYFQIIAMRKRLAEQLRAEAQSLKMRSLGQLTAGIAHDFNNLLTVIGGNIELFELEHPELDRQRYLAEARSATERSAILIANLLAYARKSKMHSARHSIGHLLDRADGMLMRVLPASIEFQVHQPDTMVEMEVDKVMFESAILNLVINARDALKGRSGRICIKTAISPEGDMLVLSVEDDGPGMEPAILADATNPFFTTKDVGQGSGLGLSMVQGFAEQSGGTFELCNRSPRGMLARLCLPILPATAPVQGSSAAG